jgi:hypothetical protein
MPEIYAKYDKTTVTGYNAAERIGSISDAAPSVAITQFAPRLGTFMDSIRREGNRSAYACAEAQALALLVASVVGATDFSKIEFSVPTSDSGLLLWQPCGNCSEWLVQKNGWGSSRTYKLNDVALELCPTTPSTSFFVKAESYDSLFPPLK